jgi:4-hydroxybenzoate polyprenyltransferase
MTSAWKSNWKHLRLPFQLTLAPIFLWGALLSGAAASERLVLGFVLFHFLLYTGITAYNSVYDRDEGPIGGLEQPPKVHRSLLPLALSLKAAGLLVAFACGVAFASIYAVFVVLSFLYSHPRTRWKANPLFSTLVVCIGQGMLGFTAGWAAARGGMGGLLTEVGWLGILSAGFTTLGMYPITQVYQIEEDARRGDRTLSVVLGMAHALRLSQAAFGIAGVAALRICALRFGPIDGVVMGFAYLAILFGIKRLRGSLAAMEGRVAFRTIMRMLYASSAAFACFILFEWFNGWRQ